MFVDHVLPSDIMSRHRVHRRAQEWSGKTGQELENFHRSCILQPSARLDDKRKRRSIETGTALFSGSPRERYTPPGANPSSFEHAAAEVIRISGKILDSTKVAHRNSLFLAGSTRERHAPLRRSRVKRRPIECIIHLASSMTFYRTPSF